MASIDIRHTHSLTPAKARKAIEEVAGKLRERFAVETWWEGDLMHFKRSGVDGHIALQPHQLHVSAQLGFLLGAMKGSIESEIRKVLDERFS